MARVLLVSALFLAAYVSVASTGALGGLSLYYFILLLCLSPFCILEVMRTAVASMDALDLYFILVTIGMFYTFCCV